MILPRPVFQIGWRFIGPVPSDRRRFWPRFIGSNPDFAAYREQAHRDVALVVLEVIEPG